ncbi:TonB-dependent receptor [Flavobacterium sp. HBTb2-11-1]|uniref:SusC/RagA family TonB-linked outer membrane protein n=1 Tax=Flavobacterium sp. HBTb2-11-1 TaxID=2692212 RepID=UPI00136BBDB9|nr:TonB-dependent receptor [Flavobacterium sp. HBTb2-11-1]MXO04437.1 SusC/RagA family TonB-linked outer membrane protein [Flavobacterium sp. HBTb2-11-1]
MKRLHANQSFASLCFFFFFLFASAQQKEIQGIITDVNKNPLPGATILVKGTKNGTNSDFDGKFSIKANSGDQLIVSFIGFSETKLTVDGSKFVTIILRENINNLEDVVVVGYVKEKKADISGAISIVKVADLAQEASPNVLTALQGRVAGIQVNSGGTPGGNDSQITIRGLTTVNSGSAPLWVIDGVQTTNPTSLNTDEIESMQVLKDGASTAIYGTSAANGVIVVTTKKGKKGTSEFTFKTEATVNMLRDRINVLHAQQWADVDYQAQLGAGIQTPTHPVLINNGSGFTIPQYLDPNGVQSSADTDWVKTITSPSISTNNDLSYRKGTERLNLYSSVNYAVDNGVQRYTYFDRLNLRLNTSYTFFDKKLTIGENFLYSKFNEVKANEFENAVLQNPIIPVYTNLGDYAAPLSGGFQDKPNPLANLWGNRKNKQMSQRILGNVYGSYAIIPDLVFSSTLNFDYGTFKFKTASEAFSVNGAIPSTFQNITTEDTNNDYLATIFTNTLKYDKDFNKHRISLLLGVENTARQDNVHSDLVRGVDITDPSGYIIRPDAEYQTIKNETESYKISQFMSGKYIYDDRYILSGSVRRDGSSRFGPNNKFAIFPSAAVAWNINKESFFPTSKYFSNAKFRASWGVNGNDQIGDYLYLSSFINNTVAGVIEYSDYDIEGDGFGTLGGILQTRQANPDIKWEKTTQYNVGFDLGFFDNKLQLQTDFFIKTTDDLILNPIALAVSGESRPPTINAGSVSNKGYEVVLSYKDKIKDDFNYGVDFNLSQYKNNVESLDTESNFLLNNSISITKQGSPIASFYGLIADGIFRTPEEVAVHADQPGKALGRIRYRDLNGDGVIDQNDRTIIGNPHPDFIYGINLYASYKAFDISMYFDGKQGNDIYNTQRNIGDFAYFGYNHGTNTLDAWTPENANSNIPALSTLNSNNETQPSSYYVEDGSYLRLKTITIGYTLDPKIVRGFGMTSLRFNLIGQNLFTLTNFSGFDYEVAGLSAAGIGIAGYGIPHSKSVTFGVNANF